MNWYYVDAGQQAGPVDDSQLEQLARTGRIQPDTLVWREGMANWQSYQQAVGPGAASPSPPAAITTPVPSEDPNDAVCAECNRIFNQRDMIQYGTVHVCAGCKPIFMQKLAEGARVNTGVLNYAGFWIRFVAKFIDGLILTVVFIAPILFLTFRASQRPGNPEIVLQLVFNVVYFVANAGYTIFFLGKYGATPGKMACKLQVLTADGGKIGYGRATGRFFAEILSGMICYIGYIIVAFDSQKRALHDHICNTRVVYK